MDEKSDIPDIKPEVNREEKKPGLLAGLLARFGLGSGSAGGMSVGTGVGTGIGAGIGGGMLATKAGLIGLILAGTTVAGSIGVVGYKIFGPTSSDRTDADFSSIFQPKPKSEASSSGGEGNAQAGSGSSSLESLVKANANENLFSQPKAAQETASVSATTPPMKNNNAPSQGPAARLKMDRKIGELTKGVGGTSGGGGGSSASSGKPSLMTGQGTGMNMTGGARAGTSAMGIQRRAASNAFSQLGQANKDYHSGLTDYEKGRVYTGAAVQKAAIGTAGGSTSGVGATEGVSAKNASANPTGSGDRWPPLPTTPGENVTPWQNAMNTAYMLLMAALAALYFATTLNADSCGTYLKEAVIALAMLAAICGGLVMSLGASISNGSYGQPLQGGILTAAGACVIAAATAAIWGTGDANFATKGLGKSGFVMLMYVCGGMAALGMVISYMSPSTSYDSTTFADGKAPDRSLL